MFRIMVSVGRLIFMKLPSTLIFHLRQLHDACGWKVSLGYWALIYSSLHPIKPQTENERQTVLSVTLILHFVWNIAKFTLLKLLMLQILFKHSGTEEFSGSLCFLHHCWKFRIKKDGVDTTCSMHMEDETYVVGAKIFRPDIQKPRQNWKCREWYIVPSMVRLKYQLKSALK